MITRYKHKDKKRAVRVRTALKSTRRDYKLTVHKTNKYLYAQMIKLSTGQTLFGVMSNDPVEAGKSMAKKSKAAKIDEVVFDRGRSIYHGIVKLFAESARENGLKF